MTIRQFGTHLRPDGVFGSHRGSRAPEYLTQSPLNVGKSRYNVGPPVDEFPPESYPAARRAMRFGIPMSVIVHLFVRPRRGAPLEDLGNVSVTPKPVRAAVVEFDYRGRRRLGTVTLIDPHNWEKRPDVIPQVHVQLSEPTHPEGITRLRRS